MHHDQHTDFPGHPSEMPSDSQSEDHRVVSLIHRYPIPDQYLHRLQFKERRVSVETRAFGAIFLTMALGFIGWFGVNFEAASSLFAT